MIGRADYDAFGIPLLDSLIGKEFGYRGEATESLTGLQYLRARHYDPSTGRFASRDPFPGLEMNPTTRHSYLYALNNPIRNSDPSGMIPQEFTLAGRAVIAGLVGAGISVLVNAAVMAFKDDFSSIEWQGSFSEGGLGALGIEGDFSFLELVSEEATTKEGKKKGHGCLDVCWIGVKAELLQLSGVTGGITMLSPGIWGLHNFVFAGLYALWGSSAFVVFEGGTTSKLFAGLGGIQRLHYYNSTNERILSSRSGRRRRNFHTTWRSQVFLRFLCSRRNQ